MSGSLRSSASSYHGNFHSSSGRSLMPSTPMRTFAIARPAILSVTKLLGLAITNLPLSHAAPVALTSLFTTTGDGAKSAADPTLWVYLAVAVALVLLGGVFAGLTIALMGQDDVNLQVVHASGEGQEKKHAGRVLRLLKRGKHWVLVTLLLGNVITNETLPIVLDRSLGGGWPAVLGSTVLIVIFGEIIPQSICVRYGLPIGAWMSPLVLLLMYVLAPAAWPTAKLLDYLLGEDQGTVYKKAGLKTLVGLHKTLGTSPQERLNEDEVTIISAVLDLKDKAVGSIMTPMDDVFTMSEDVILDEKTMDTILSEGYSRIPIHATDNEENFVGMLLVKILITYDPEDCKRVGDFSLATLPETKPDASCLDIVNYFQEGKSHMVLVSDSPGEDYGALGVVTLEDVIEELIGEEIIDESDVFIDVHKAIRRLTPAQQTRLPKHHNTVDKDDIKAIVDADGEEDLNDRESPEEVLQGVTSINGVKQQADSKPQAKARASASELGTSPRANLMMRRQSSLVNTLVSSNKESGSQPAPLRSNAPDMREHLKHLGPSNLASRPKSTRYNTVKIKQGAIGAGNLHEEPANGPFPKASPSNPDTNGSFSLANPAPQGGIGEGLLSSAGKDAKGGVQALQSGYGTMERTSSPRQTSDLSSTKGVQANIDSTLPQKSPEADRTALPRSTRGSRRQSRRDSNASHSTIGSLHERSKSPYSKNNVPMSPKTGGNRVARTGSITENVVEAGGVRKVVLETTSSGSSSDDGETEGGGTRGGGVQLSSETKGKEGSNGARNEDGDRSEGVPSQAGSSGAGGGGKKKRRRRRRRHGGADRDQKSGEETPLLEGSS